MGVVIAIIAGLVAMTALAAGFDYLGKRSKGISGDLEKKVLELENRVSLVESTVAAKEDEIRQLEHKIEFMDKLLEDKTKE
jgi:TolA-binding protein